MFTTLLLALLACRPAALSEAEESLQAGQPLSALAALDRAPVEGDHAVEREALILQALEALLAAGEFDAVRTYYRNDLRSGPVLRGQIEALARRAEEAQIRAVLEAGDWEGVLVLLQAEDSELDASTREQLAEEARDQAILGVWYRIQDNTVGTVLEVTREGEGYTGTLTTVDATYGRFGFKPGQVKWRNVTWSEGSTWTFDNRNSSGWYNRTTMVFEDARTVRLDVKGGGSYSKQRWSRDAPVDE